MATLSKERLRALAERIKGSPELQKQLLGNLGQQPSTTSNVIQRVGLGGQPITKSEREKATGAAISETSPKAGREGLQFQQKQAERARSLDLFGSTGQPGTLTGLTVPQGFQEIPATRREEGGVAIGFREKPEIVEQRKADALRLKAEVEQEQAEKQARQNVSLIGGAALRFSQTYVDAIREGGVGGLGRSIRSGIALKVGGESGERFPATGALLGQKTEMITKMMPLLTQQGDKKGSVRLVSTVFDKLMKTLPENNTPEIVGRRQISETMKNMFGFSKAIGRMGVNNKSVEDLSKEQLSKLGDSIESFSKTIQLTPREQEELDDLLSTVLGPIDELIAERKQVEGASQELEETQDDLNAIDAELQKLGGL